MRGGAQKARGAMGEKLAENALRKRGARILERNFTCPFGEIDLIAQQKGWLLFVEVKLRKEGAEISGEDAIGAQKRARLIRTAQAYLKAHPLSLQPRFDAAVITEKADGTFSIEYYENAFDAAGGL